MYSVVMGKQSEKVDWLLLLLLMLMLLFVGIQRLIGYSIG